MIFPWYTDVLSISNIKLRLLVSEAHSQRWLILWPGITGVAEQYYLFLQQGPLHGTNVIAVDPPGHGFSDDWQGALTEDDIRAIWHAIIEHFEIRHAFIGGHSYGGYCALLGSSLGLESVRGAILLDGGYEPARDAIDLLRNQVKDYIEDTVYTDWQHYLEDERTYTPYWDDDLAGALKSYMKETRRGIQVRMSVKAAWEGLSLMDAFNPAKVPQSDKPVLLLLATLPQSAENQRLKDVLTLQERLRALQCLPVPNAGHSVILHNRTFVLDAVWTFLETAAI